MKLLAFLILTGLLSFDKFVCSGKSKYQDFSSDSTGSNYVKISSMNTLSVLNYLDPHKLSLDPHLAVQKTNNGILFE